MTATQLRRSLVAGPVLLVLALPAFAQKAGGKQPAPARKPGTARKARVTPPQAPAVKPRGTAQGPAQGKQPPGKLAPAVVWPAGLEKLAGRYVFLQVASPGGFWVRLLPAGGNQSTRRQVSLNEVPAAFRDRLTRAEIVISDLALPTQSEAQQRDSPTGRGKLRFYVERTRGRVTVRNLPGIGSLPEDQDEFSGPVLFSLEHQSHSNPSVSGVLYQRNRMESTWGAATLDYADLQASTLPENEDDEGMAIIGNARTLRSGVEIFVFVEWTERDAEGERHYTGSVRLGRAGTPDGPAAPAP